MSNFYTRSGDDGFTSLLGKGRVPKYHPQPEAYGDLDETSAALGFARALCKNPQNARLILQVQRDLYGMMAEIAATPENAAQFRKITSDHVLRLERESDALGERIEMPREFIIPGDSSSGAAISLARTITRRAERRIVRLYHEGTLTNPAIVQYLNRLSSLLFALELFENKISGVSMPTLARDDTNP